MENTMFKTKSLLAIALGAAFSMNAMADSFVVEGPMAFNPIPASAYLEATTDATILNSTPWVIPKGYRQFIVSDERALDIYPGISDLSDMITVNETKKHAGRYMYRTHEVRPGADLNTFAGGALSVVDLKTGEAKIIAQRKDWEALDGIVWTPWHTVLFAEETITARLMDSEVPQATSGLLYEMELDKHDPMTAKKVSVRPLLGSLSHEGIQIDAEGNVYVIDEDRNGAIYKFVPKNFGDLSAGQLYALRVLNGAKTGEAEWIALDMNQVQISARVAASAVSATPFCRPEDMQRISDTLYVALTCEDVANPLNTRGEGAVLSVKLGKKPMVNYFVAHGVNVVKEDKINKVTGFKSPDNLAASHDGKLWIVEDNDYSDIWVAEPDLNGDGYSDSVNLFASLKDVPAEGTGIYFGKDAHTLYVNVQHSGTGNDKTVAITNREEEHEHGEK
jgi:uncharacterized protein